MNRRAMLGRAAGAVAAAATGSRVATAACDDAAAGDSAGAPRWIFPAGDYRIGIDSRADRSSRLVVFGTPGEPARVFRVPLPAPRTLARGRHAARWIPAPAADEPAAPASPDAAPPDGVRLDFAPVPGATAFVDCCGVGSDGKAYVVAVVFGTGPTYLVRLDPAGGTFATLALAERPLDVVALYRRPSQDAFVVVVGDGKDLHVRNAPG